MDKKDFERKSKKEINNIAIPDEWWDNLSLLVMYKNAFKITHVYSKAKIVTCITYRKELIYRRKKFLGKKASTELWFEADV